MNVDFSIELNLARWFAFPIGFPNERMNTKMKIKILIPHIYFFYFVNWERERGCRSENSAGRTRSAASTFAGLIEFGVFDFNQFHVFLCETLIFRVDVCLLRLFHECGHVGRIDLLSFLFFFVQEYDTRFDFLEVVHSWRCSGFFLVIFRLIRRGESLGFSFFFFNNNFVVLVLVIIFEFDVFDFVDFYFESSEICRRRFSLLRSSFLFFTRTGLRGLSVLASLILGSRGSSNRSHSVILSWFMWGLRIL